MKQLKMIETSKLDRHQLITISQKYHYLPKKKDHKNKKTRK